MPNRICIVFRWLRRFELMALDESTTFDKSGKEPNPGHKFFEVNGLFYNKLKCGREECFIQSSSAALQSLLQESNQSISCVLIKHAWECPLKFVLCKETNS